MPDQDENSSVVWNREMPRHHRTNQSVTSLGVKSQNGTHSLEGFCCRRRVTGPWILEIFMSFRNLQIFSSDRRTVLSAFVVVLNCECVVNNKRQNSGALVCENPNSVCFVFYFRQDEADEIPNGISFWNFPPETAARALFPVLLLFFFLAHFTVWKLFEYICLFECPRVCVWMC